MSHCHIVTLFQGPSTYNVYFVFKTSQKLELSVRTVFCNPDVERCLISGNCLSTFSYFALSHFDLCTDLCI